MIGAVIPPLKYQGIKTKLIPMIREIVDISGAGTYIEPFLGSGCVALSLAPRKAVLADKNPHVIRFYKAIQDGELTAGTARDFLEYHGEELAKYGDACYKRMREEFNRSHDPLCFLFLNRSCFNGVVRFNLRGEFNVPYCKRDNRFSKAYITKICNQIGAAADIIRDSDWTLVCQDWRETMALAKRGDTVYLDPPYVGRNTGYIGPFDYAEGAELADAARMSKARVYLSMWKESKGRRNDYLYDCWQDGFTWYEAEHYYFVGPKFENRGGVVEVLAEKVADTQG